VGRLASARQRCHSKLPATARQDRTDGGHRGCRARRRPIAAGDLERETRGGTGGGPQRVSPNDLAAAFAKVLGHPLRAETVPRETWGTSFLAQGMEDPLPRIQMLDGFNEGWIDFEGEKATVLKGQVDLETVLRALVSEVG
jgi:uncharacterized protein YbjT (DUF2867 family)